MGFLSRTKDKKEEEVIETAPCPHTSLVQRWDLPEDMGNKEKATYVCDACGGSSITSRRRNIWSGHHCRPSRTPLAKTRKFSKLKNPAVLPGFFALCSSPVRSLAGLPVSTSRSVAAVESRTFPPSPMHSVTRPHSASRRFIS